ncbi:MAG: hypothetical protein E7513_03490 [Ruminococcaceae bacterium]|nr:hypothetical protein [Oscillospiraceae bacterium]
MNPNSEQKRIAFGYNREYGKIVCYKTQALCVKLIFMFYLEGRSISNIKEVLESMGLPSPLNRPKWGKQVIANILSNPHYTGIDGYPQIITPEDFEEVQKIKASKTYK